MQSDEDVIMMKGTRSKRPRPPSPFALTTATTSSTTAGLAAATAAFITYDFRSSDRVTPSPSNSGELTQSRDEEEEDMANCLILLAKGHCQTPPRAAAEAYQCKTCNRSFPSFQALGGHRASHKTKPNKEEDDDTINLSLQITNRVISSNQNKSRVHECSICGAEFASGQALGGHMRRHRPIPAAGGSSSYGDQYSQEVKRPRIVLSLDLNHPAPEDDDCSESSFGYGPKEQVIVFSTSSFVDCHY